MAVFVEQHQISWFYIVHCSHINIKHISLIEVSLATKCVIYVFDVLKNNERFFQTGHLLLQIC